MNSFLGPFPYSKRSAYVVAMLLGTALLGTAQQGTAAEVPDTTGRAIADISRYCTACWRNARLHPDCWSDCTQEVFRRLMERVAPETWGGMLKCESEERREFLRAIDTVKKRTQRRRSWSTHPIESVEDRHDLHERRLNTEREVVRHAAAELLTPRQQRILQLSFEGWSVHDIAEEMKLGTERVSDEKYKAIRKLRSHLCRSSLEQG